MSDQAEALITRMLEKTNSGKLEWVPMESLAGETYRSDLGEGVEVRVWRTSSGDEKTYAVQVSEGGAVTLIESASNSQSTRFVPGAIASNLFGGILSPVAFIANSPYQDASISRFRKFSDLFSAARNSAMGITERVKPETVESVQRLLERLR